MAATLRDQSQVVNKLSENLAHLQQYVSEYDFYQVIRLTRGFADKLNARVIFKTEASTAFSQSAISRIHYEESQNTLCIYLNVLLLVGAQGILPDHYTELVHDRQIKKDDVLHSFLDVFIQRIAELYFSTWNKTHAIQLPTQFSKEGVTGLLRALCGNAGSWLSKETEEDSHHLYYCGLYLRQVRPRESLQAILADYFNLPISIYNYSGEWIRIPQPNRSLLAKNRSLSAYNRLGIDACMGSRYWDPSRYFDIEIGPVDRGDFQNLLPCYPLLQQLKELVTDYVGEQYRYRIYIKLSAGVMQRCQLKNRKRRPMRLGWDSWLGAKRRIAQTVRLGDSPNCCINAPIMPYPIGEANLV